MSGEKQNGRIEWCDIYKGIVIALVVLGHATSVFNRYIYQFHMAAFFFISGCTGRARGESLFREFIRKLYKLLIPYYVISLTGIGLFGALNRAELLGFVSGTNYPESFGKALSALFGKNVIYCDWLGAIWFLWVLFLATLLFKLLAALFQSDALLGLASALLFLYAAKLPEDSVYPFDLDLVLRAQAFLVMGYLARRVIREEEKNWHLAVKILLIWAVWVGSVQVGILNIVDWPDRNFNGPVDLIQPLFGILLTINVAKLLSRSRMLKKFFRYLGQNSMGIMFFHFLGFKAAYLLLICLGRMELQDIARLTPGADYKFWWPLTLAVGLAVSVLLWKGINRISIVRRLLGGGSAEKFYDRVTGFKVVSRVGKGYDFLASRINSLLERGRAFLKPRKWLTGAFCAAVIIAVIGLELSPLLARIEVTFPCEGDAVAFEGGWLSQSDMEAYRWFEEEAAVSLVLKSQTTLEIQGYIPESVENMTYMAISMNGTEIYHEPARGGSAIDIRLDIEEYVVPGQINTITLETDGVKIAGDEDTDKRDYSAMVHSIAVY